jgi:hypothetical protein
VPQALIVSYLTLVWATRDIEVLIMFAGQVGCELLNGLLKWHFREARPTGERIESTTSTTQQCRTTTTTTAAGLHVH